MGGNGEASRRDTESGSFLIIGCQRSGTTLLRLALECHSQIECWDELVAYDFLAGRAEPPRTRGLVGLKVPSLTEQLNSARIGDPYVNLDIPNPYRGQKLIFMVRDVRDTVFSMLRLRVFGVPWIKARAISTLRAKLQSAGEFTARYGELFTAALRGADPHLSCAALYWRYKSESLFEYLARLPVLPVRYEDLTLDPEAELRRICEFLNVPWESGLLHHPRFAHSELTPEGMAIGDTDPNRSIDTGSVNGWRASFDEAQALRILEYAGVAQRLLYPAALP